MAHNFGYYVYADTENPTSANNIACSDKGSQRRRPIASNDTSTQQGERNHRGRAHNVVRCGD